MTMALHFQRLLQTQLNDEDALTVLAPGLGLRFLLADLLRRYCDPAHFVVVVNATAEEEDFLVRHLALEDVQPLPLVINNEVAVADRSETTREQNGRAPARASRADLEHGALATARAAPPRPLPASSQRHRVRQRRRRVCDVAHPGRRHAHQPLSNEQPHRADCVPRGAVRARGCAVALAPPLRIANASGGGTGPPSVGLAGVRARPRSVTEYSAEALVVRHYRQATRAGFIKAVSEDPQELVSGFAHLEKTLRTLFLSRVHLWPRYGALPHRLDAHGRHAHGSGRTPAWTPRPPASTLTSRRRWTVRRSTCSR